MRKHKLRPMAALACLKSSANRARPLRPLATSLSRSSLHPCRRYSSFDPSRTPRHARTCEIRAASSHCRRTLATSAEPASAEEKYAVVGGGLAGLTTAYYLAKYRPDAKVTLYEAGDRLGGWIKTEKRDVVVDGATKQIQVEWGPRGIPETTMSNCWKFDDLVFWDLIADLGLRRAITLVPHMPRFIYQDGKLKNVAPSLDEFLPGGLFSGLLSTMVNVKTTQARKAYFIPERVIAPDDDLSVTEWLSGIGVHPLVIDNLVSAMLHGIHGGSPDSLSARSVFDAIYWRYYNFHKPEKIMPQENEIIDKLGDVPIPNLSALTGGKSLSMMHFGTNGMKILPDTLASTLRASPNIEIKLSTSISDISFDREKEKLTISTKSKTNAAQHQEQYDQVVATIPSQTLASITSNKLPSLAQTKSTSMWVVQLWYPYLTESTQGLGYLIPRSVPLEENPHRVLGVMFDHSLGIRGEDETPGSKLFVLMGGHFYDSGEVLPPTSEAEAIQQAESLVEKHLGFDNSIPHFSAAHFQAECIPQLNVGHQKRMNDAHDDLRRHFGEKLICAGGSYTKPGVLGALRAGFDAANEVLCLNKQTVSTGIRADTKPVEFEAEYIPRSAKAKKAFFNGGLVKYLKWGLQDLR